jgi:hypothetical protein
MYRTPRKYTGQKRTYWRRYGHRSSDYYVRRPTHSYSTPRNYSFSGYKLGGGALAIVTVLGWIALLFWKLIFWVVGVIFKGVTSVKEGSFKLNNTQQGQSSYGQENATLSTPEEPARNYKQEFSAFNDKIQALRQTNSTSVAGVTNTPNVLDQQNRYGLKTSLLTASEIHFLETLKQVVEDRFNIECQVPLSGIVTILDSNNNFTNYRDFNQIKAKTIDFVLYDKSFKPYVCIELDGSSHMRLDRIKRDIFINNLMKSVGLRIIHVYPASDYDKEDLESQIFKE